jgi:O-antigen ligase
MENAAPQATAFRPSVDAAAVRSAGPGLPQLPFYIIMVVAAGAVALVAGGESGYLLPVKAAIAILVIIAATLAIFWKPAVFPIAAYLFMVPFDNLLRTGGGTVTKMLAGASIIVALLVMVGDRRRTMTPALPAVLAWLAFVAWSVVSLSWSIGLTDSFSWVTMVSELFALYAIFATFRIREDEVRVLVWAIVAGGVACSAYGLWLYHTGTFVSSSGVSQLRLNIQLGNNGSIGSINSDHFAGALVLPIALALALTLRVRGLRKWLGWLALVMLFGGVFVSGTRSAVIAIGLVWLYLIIFSPYGRKQLVAMGVAGLLASLALPTVWLRFTDPTQGVDNGNGRYGIWTIGWDAFRNHWLAGSGAGDFRDAYTAAFFKAYQMNDNPPMVQDAHNMIVSTAVELGLIGLVLLLAAWFFQFRSVSRIARSSRLFDLRLAAEAGLIGLCFTALTLDVLYFKYLWIGFMIAVLIRNASVCEQEAIGQPRTANQVVTAR